jgi:hypothetical protein
MSGDTLTAALTFYRRIMAKNVTTTIKLTLPKAKMLMEGLQEVFPSANTLDRALNWRDLHRWISGVIDQLQG